MAKRHLALEVLKQGGVLALCRTLLLFLGIGAAAEFPGSSRYDGNDALIAARGATARPGDLPAQYSMPAKIVAETVLMESDRATSGPLAVDDDKKLQPVDGAPRLWRGLGHEIEAGRYARSVAPATIAGFNSRAPPAG